MSRKPAVTLKNFRDIKQIIADVEREDKETLKDYVVRVNRYCKEKEISDETLSRILRSETYEDYKGLVRQRNQHKKPMQKPDSEEQKEQRADDTESAESDAPQQAVSEADQPDNEVLLRILSAITSNSPCEGSSIDGLSRNICGSLKKIKGAIEDQTNMMDSYLSDISGQIAELKNSIDSLIESNRAVEEGNYISALKNTFGPENVREVSSL